MISATLDGATVTPVVVETPRGSEVRVETMGGEEHTLVVTGG